MRLLVTGAAGFIGSNFVHYWLGRRPGDHVVALDLLTYAGDRRNLTGLGERLVFVEGDIGDLELGQRVLAAEQIARIRRRSTLGTTPFSERKMGEPWSLLAIVPISLFVRHELPSLSGLEATGNLYKCGDHLTVPHYVTWNRIESPAPDYHRPEQFGRLSFD